MKNRQNAAARFLRKLEHRGSSIATATPSLPIITNFVLSLARKQPCQISSWSVHTVTATRRRAAAIPRYLMKFSTLSTCLFTDHGQIYRVRVHRDWLHDHAKFPWLRFIESPMGDEKSKFWPCFKFSFLWWCHLVAYRQSSTRLHNHIRFPSKDTKTVLWYKAATLRPRLHNPYRSKAWSTKNKDIAKKHPAFSFSNSARSPSPSQLSMMSERNRKFSSINLFVSQ